MTNPPLKALDACNIYILLWLLGYVQNLFLNSSWISIVFYIPYLGMTLYYIAKIFTTYHPKGVMRALSVFFLILVFYGVALVLLNNVPGQDRKSFLMMLFGSLGPVFAFYVFTQHGLLTDNRIHFWFFVFLVVATISFFVNRQKVLELLAENNSQFEDVTNNSAYTVLTLLPFVFIIRKNLVWQYVIVGVLMVLVIMGMKRGAILTGIVMLLWFVFVNTKTVSKKRRFFSLLLTIVLIIIGWRFTIQFYEANEYFQYRLEMTLEGSSSNRNWIYSTLWQHYINNNNILQLAFGEGAFHTVNITGGLKAHNDWIELLIDCGFMGVFFYFVYWVCFIRDWVKSNQDVLVYSMMGSCLIYTLLKTFFSMSFGDNSFYICMILGYCFAHVDTNHYSK